jgi:threonine/homoserine/homoserine lactone efflux protein
LATGVVLSDLFLCVLVCVLVHLGATSVLQDEKNQRFAGILAGTLLIGFGSYYFKKRVEKTDETIEVKGPHPLMLLTKGFFLNLFNPAVWFLWIGNVTAISKTLDYSFVKMLFYFLVVLSLTLLVELFKISLAEKIKRFLTERIMHIVNYVTGGALVIFGVILIYNHYFGH